VCLLSERTFRSRGRFWKEGTTWYPLVGMRLRYLLALGLTLWGCSDGSEGFGSGRQPAPQQTPAPTEFEPQTPPVDPGPPPPIVILEKGTLNWPFGTWIDGVSVGNSSSAIGEDGSAHFSFGMDSKHAELLTHSHWDLTEGHKSILVRARASAPVTILVTTASSDTLDYWSALSAGHPWRVAEMPLDTTWTDLDIPIASLKAAGPGEPAPFGPGYPMGIVLFGFILTNPGAIDVWFEHIEIN